LINGIGKSFRRGDRFIFVDIQSHNLNMQRIAESINKDFIGYPPLLAQACVIHDLWKVATLNPDVLVKGKGVLFRNHGIHFPSNLVHPTFSDIEFDLNKRRQNFKNYYILNLVRLHHTGLSTYALFENAEFIYEIKSSDIQKWMVRFIKDWYAIKTIDWIDSAIMSALFQGGDLELGLISEIELAWRDTINFYVLQEGFVLADVHLTYKYIEMSLGDIKKILASAKKGPGKRENLNKKFMELLADAEIKEVYLNAS
jgi:hypothetical protein